MFQEILTYIIVFCSIGYVVYKTINFFWNANKISKKSPCKGCSSGSCSGCAFAGKYDFKSYNSSIKS